MCRHVVHSTQARIIHGCVCMAATGWIFANVESSLEAVQPAQEIRGMPGVRHHSFRYRSLPGTYLSGWKERTATSSLAVCDTACFLPPATPTVRGKRGYLLSPADTQYLKHLSPDSRQMAQFWSQVGIPDDVHAFYLG